MKTAVPKVKSAWDGGTTTSHGTMWWDDATQNHHQTPYHCAVPMGRDVGTRASFSSLVPSHHILRVGRWDDLTSGSLPDIICI